MVPSRLQQRIFGWTPSDGEEHVEIPPRPHRPVPQILTYQTSGSTDGASHQSSPAGDGPFPLTLSTSSRPQKDIFDISKPVRRGDPSWVARPRNPFIIFRCEYTRKHRRKGKRIRNSGVHVDKGLSKRAGEAWHSLSDEERYQFKVRAEQEKEEHIRKHPEYRYRPMKRGTKSSSKQTEDPPRTSSQEANTTASPPAHRSARGVPPASIAPKIPAPPILLSLPGGPDDALKVQHPPTLSVNTDSVKSTRRRSASVPSLLIGQQTFNPDLWSSQQPTRAEVEIKRARSATGNRMVPPSTLYGNLFEPRPSFPNVPSPHSFYGPQDVYLEDFIAGPDDVQSPQDSPPCVSPQETMMSASPWGGEPFVDAQPIFPQCGPLENGHYYFQTLEPDIRFDDTETITSGVRDFSFAQGAHLWVTPPNSSYICTPQFSSDILENQLGQADYSIYLNGNLDEPPYPQYASLYTNYENS